MSFLHGVEVIDIDGGIRPITTQRSSVVAIIGSAGKGAVNTPSLIVGSRAAGVLAFGPNDGDGFTIPAALDAIFDQSGAMVVVVNAFDHTDEDNATDVTSESVVLATTGIGTTAYKYISAVTLGTSITAPATFDADDEITLPSGATLVSVKDSTGSTTYVEDTDYTIDAGVITIIAEAAITSGQTVLIAYTATLAVTTDYTVDADTGQITRVADGDIMANATLSVSYSYADPTNCTETMIIGGIDGSGNASGVHCLNEAKSELGVTPRIIAIPGWTHQKANDLTANAVVAEVLGIAEKLKAIILADCPDTTKEDAVIYRGDWGSDRIFTLYPWGKVADPAGGATPVSQPLSGRVAGLISKVDNDEGFWTSPSNHIINGLLGLSKPVEFALGDRNTVANYLNENRVTTVIRESGFRLWGNRTTTVDAKYSFLSVRRTADLVHESILLAHLWAVDNSITKGLVESIVNGVNAYLRSLKSRGAVLGGSAWADPDLNTPTSIANGELFIDFDFTPPYPAEHITFRAHLVNDYLTEIIG